MLCSECSTGVATRKGKCHNCYQRAWMRAHYSTTREKAMRWRAVNRERVIWLGAKNRARKQGVDFTITPYDIKIPAACPILGVLLLWNDKRDFRPSIDRRDNAKGYTVDNICVISMRANRIKNDATLEELRAILRYADSA